MRIYVTLVESKLLYGLTSMCMTKADSRRLDGFQARCLRQACGIPPSFISRVSNAIVRSIADHPSASSVLQQHQLQMLGRILRTTSAAPLSAVSFMPGTLRPATCRYIRRVGRPRKEWIPSVLQEAYRRNDGRVDLEAAAASPKHWKEAVVDRCR